MLLKKTLKSNPSSPNNENKSTNKCNLEKNINLDQNLDSKKIPKKKIAGSEQIILFHV